MRNYAKCGNAFDVLRNVQCGCLFILRLNNNKKAEMFKLMAFASESEEKKIKGLS